MMMMVVVVVVVVKVMMMMMMMKVKKFPDVREDTEDKVVMILNSFGDHHLILHF